MDAQKMESERRIIDGSEKTFLEFQQYSKDKYNRVDLKLWRNALLAKVEDSYHSSLDCCSNCTDEQRKQVSIPEPWRSKGYCHGCYVYVEMVDLQLKHDGPIQNWAIGAAQGITDCFCNAQEKLTWEQLSRIEKISFYW